MSTTEIQFSQEELLYLLRSLNLPDIPGMGERPWGHIPQEQALLVMETAGRGLVARGIVRFGKTQIEVDNAVAQLLRTMAYPVQMTVLTYSLNAQAIPHNFFRGKTFDVEHTLPYPWVHRLHMTPKSDMGESFVQGLLKDVPGSGESPAFSVPQQVLTAIRQDALETSQASDTLVEAGLPESMALSLIEVLTAPTSKVLVQAVYQLTEIEQNMFSILANQDSCWVISAGKPGSPMTQVMQVGPQRLTAIVNNAFQPFKPVKK